MQETNVKGRFAAGYGIIQLKSLSHTTYKWEIVVTVSYGRNL
jgi:hypothetical protein